MTIISVIYVRSSTKTKYSSDDCSDYNCATAARIAVVNRIIIAIAIQVQAVYGFGVEVGGIVGRDKSAPFGGVIPGVAIIQAGVVGTVIAIVTKTGGFAVFTSTYLFYHLPLPQSRKMPHPSYGVRQYVVLFTVFLDGFNYFSFRNFKIERSFPYFLFSHWFFQNQKLFAWYVDQQAKVTNIVQAFNPVCDNTIYRFKTPLD